MVHPSCSSLWTFKGDHLLTVKRFCRKPGLTNPYLNIFQCNKRVAEKQCSSIGHKCNASIHSLLRQSHLTSRLRYSDRPQMNNFKTNFKGYLVRYSHRARPLHISFVSCLHSAFFHFGKIPHVYVYVSKIPDQGYRSF